MNYKQFCGRNISHRMMESIVINHFATGLKTVVFRSYEKVSVDFTSVERVQQTGTQEMSAGVWHISKGPQIYTKDILVACHPL